VVGRTSASELFSASVAGKEISVEKAAASTVVVKAGQGGQVKLRLPQIAASTPVQTRNGTVVQQGRDVSTAVQVLADGHVRALVTMENDKAPKSYAFGFELPAGLALRASKTDGGVDIVSEDGSFVAGKIAAPWAKDANGRDLPTSYAVEGATITQHIETTGAKFPVVADPDYVYNCGWTSCNWTFTRWYTANVMYPAITGAGSIAGAFSGAMMCGKLPGPAAVGCVAWVTVNYMQAYWYVINAKAKNQCFVARFQYVGVVSPINAFSTGIDNDSNCHNN
jgi:hypothetical protein